MLEFSKTFFLKTSAALAAAVLLAGCFQDSGLSPNAEPSTPRVVESATMQIRMRLGSVTSLQKGSTISLSKMIVVMTSNSNTPTATDTIKDTLKTSGTTPTINSVSTTEQTISKTYVVKALRKWTVRISVRDSRDSLIHWDTTTTPFMGIADTAIMNLGLSSRFAMYDANFLTIPDSISSVSGNSKQRLRVNRLVLKIDGVTVRDSLRPGFFTALGSHTLGYDYVTTAIKTVVNTSVGASVNDVHFTSATVGVFVGDNGTVRRTTNGGTNWLTPASTVGITKALRSVYFTDVNNGWIVGDSITLRTVDAGATWAPQTTPSLLKRSLKSVFFTTATVGWAVSDSVYKTTDAGVTWTRLVLVPLSYSVRFVDASTGWVVGNNSGGNIRKSINGGTSFTVQTSGTTKSLKSVFPVNENLVYAVGDTGTILRTTNGGTNWVTRPSGTTRNLKSVYFLDAAIGYAVGDNGTVLSTSDSGMTWGTQTSPVTSNLTSIQFVGGKAFVVGENGTLFVLMGPRLVEMSIYGPMGNWNVANPLFTGSKYVDVAAGVNDTIPLNLNWVGPTTGGGTITATLSKVGRVTIIGKLPGTP